MSSFIHAKNHMTLEVLCFSLFVLNIRAQLWNYDYVEQVTEDIPLWKAVRETEKSGFWDLGSGRSVKAVVFQLGGCSKGHPCGSGSGIPWFWPEGCDPVLCYRRFIGDTWRQYSFNCDNYINSSNVEWAEETFENQTKLSAEWFEYHEPSCLVRRNETTQQWTHDKSGVAIVLRAHGFTFPSQTVLVSDIDSVFDSDLWPDVPQEAVTNFAMLNGDFLKPSNTYALDHYDQLDLAFSPPILTEINITLSQTYLDALELGLTSDWVWGSISALAQNLVDNFPEDSMPKHWDVSAGGTVWAKIESEFDSM